MTNKRHRTCKCGHGIGMHMVIYPSKKKECMGLERDSFCKCKGFKEVNI